MLDRVAQAQHTMAEACRGLDRPITVMEVCGTHTVSIFRSGVRSLLPEKLRLLSGPGCPVCVTDQGYIDTVMQLADRDDCLIATYGDMIRVPGSDGSLETRAARGNVKVILSSEDAVQLARDHPDKTVVFIAVGFETTTPATAVAVQEAARAGLSNFCVLSNHKLVLPAIRALLDGMNDRIDAFLCPGHVSVIIGWGAFAEIVRDYRRPCVVAGFEPVQILEALAEISRQLAAGTPQVQSMYHAVVTERGNTAAQRIVAECFQPVDGLWRGLGKIANSTMALRPQYRPFDAFPRFGLEDKPGAEIGGCRCGAVLCGLIEPIQCPLFGTGCTPQTPIGPCMVSSEGTCAAWFKYGRRN
jgi:hydrogenase expression/formation protein HypD